MARKQTTQTLKDIIWAAESREAVEQAWTRLAATAWDEAVAFREAVRAAGECGYDVSARLPA